MANPYLTWPVVLDEYVKNRDVWRCPSGKMLAGAVFIVPGPDWLGYLRANEGQWGGDNLPGPCMQSTFPPGWGGDVTDSILQGRTAVPAAQWGGGSGGAANKSFVQTIATQEQVLWNQKMAQYQDVTHVVVAADGGANRNFFGAANLAYPDICCAECAGVKAIAWGGTPANPCQDGSPCDTEGSCAALHTRYNFATDPKVRSSYARHLGGVNIAWADGHASWMNSQSVCSASDAGDLEDVDLICASATTPKGYQDNCGGTPPPGVIFLFNGRGQ
jgi:prepilin-type processing-associated H-X9-DG protein